MEIKNNITTNEIKKIFSNTNEKKEYLNILFTEKNIKKKIPRTKLEIDNEIINTWDFNTSNKIIRKLFKNTEKYKIGKFSSNAIKDMIKEWDELEFDELNWPFSAMAFDQYIQSINTRDIPEKEKDEIVKKDVVKFRRIKKINTARNDFIEYLIVENNQNVTPTLHHNRGIDFFIDGISYDQKVSRSVTRNFINDYGNNWKEYATSHPEEVGKYLYQFQDEARFGAESRLLIVYLDEDLNEEDIYKCVTSTSLEKPYHITFEYIHSNNIIKTYTVDCYIILLHK